MFPFRTKRPLARLPFLLGFLLTACTFAPSEEYFKEIEQVSAMAYIDLSTYNETDTILLDHPTTFNFNVDVSDPSTIEQVEIVLDSKSSFSSYTTSGDFTLSPLDIPLGAHQLTIQFKAKSNSGSLADEVGAEYFQVWKTWVLKVVKYDIDPPEVPDLKITETDGRLRLDWTPYTKKNFVSYTLKLSFPQEHEIVFTDPLTTHWVDSSFLWGSATFALTVSNTHGTASNNTRIDEPQKVTFTYNASDTTASLKWKPSRFYAAFGKVVISENNTMRETLTKASDSTFTLKLKEVLWGRSESVMVQVFPKSSQHDPYESREFIYPSVKMLRNIPLLYYNAGINKVIGYSRSSSLVYFYDDLMNVTDSSTKYTSAISVPYFGNFVYYVNNNRVVRWNVATNEQVYSFDNSTYTIEPSSIHGSANAIASYFTFDWHYGSEAHASEVIVNTVDNSFIEKRESDYDIKDNYPPISRILSDDGRFSLDVHNRTLYKLQGGRQAIGSLPYLGSFFSFRPDNNDEILLTTSGSLYIISSNDLSLLRTITLPPGYSVSSYDPVTHYVVCEKTDATVVYLINIDTNNIKTFPAYSTGWGMINGYIYNYGRQYMKAI